MKNNKLYFFIILLLLVAFYAGLKYIDFLNFQSEKITNSNYKTRVLNLKNQLSEMILSKQKSTIAIAISLSTNKQLANEIKANNIKKYNYNNLIKKFKNETFYKNIWIQILDKDLNSLYRSWSDKTGDNIATFRDDLVDVVKNKKISYSINVDKFDFNIKAIVPVFLDKKFVGIIEIISHFNSIDRQFQKHGIASLVIADKRFKKQIINPFTKTFMNDYYIANFDADKKYINYLKEHGIKNYLNNSYKIENGFLIISTTLFDKENQNIGYFVMFQNLKDIKNENLDFFVFKWLTFITIAVMAILIIVGFLLYKANRKQKYYYKNIINSSTNIVLVNNKKTILSVNNSFFKYFNNYKNLDEFKKQYDCICDFFSKDAKYLQKNMDGLNWVDYLLQKHIESSKVKIKYDNNIYYFTVSASIVDNTRNHYSIIFTDITKQEKYQQELEYTSVTDALTNIKNRRYFQNKIVEEVADANRYKSSLSLIMFDIDFFKKVNDKYGHDVGDDVLIEYTKFISKQLRKNDAFCRVGGEEFIILLPHSTKENASYVANKLRKSVEEYKKIIPITMSFGVVQYSKEEDITTVLKRLDEALYEAKNTGRNKVITN